ncbi:macro domain-containing protein [Candidatus Omnitrophota bacterium]
MDRIKLIKGDITGLSVEAIVNAANAHLQMGGGVAGAILKKGGQSIQDECDKIGFTPAGQAVLTGAGSLKAKYVIHAVGPRMGEGDEDKKLLNATISSLNIAREQGLRSVAFPAISTGIFGYPLDRCARIMLKAAKRFLQRHELPKEVIFCLYDNTAYRKFELMAKKIDY